MQSIRGNVEEMVKESDAVFVDFSGKIHYRSGGGVCLAPKSFSSISGVEELESEVALYALREGEEEEEGYYKFICMPPLPLATGGKVLLGGMQKTIKYGTKVREDVLLPSLARVIGWAERHPQSTVSFHMCSRIQASQKAMGFLGRSPSNLLAWIIQ